MECVLSQRSILLLHALNDVVRDEGLFFSLLHKIHLNQVAPLHFSLLNQKMKLAFCQGFSNGY